MAFLVLVSLPAPADQPTLRPLINQDALDGCGCSFWLHTGEGSQSDVFQSDFDRGAWINLGDDDVHLNLVREEHRAVHPERSSVGDTTVLEFEADGLRVTLRSTSTSACPEENESCEASDEEGTITVTTHGVESSTRVKGVCGC